MFPLPTFIARQLGATMGSVDMGERARARAKRGLRWWPVRRLPPSRWPASAAAAQQDNALLRSEIVDTAIIAQRGRHGLRQHLPDGPPAAPW
jgi:hypothetical protein